MVECAGLDYDLFRIALFNDLHAALHHIRAEAITDFAFNKTEENNLDLREKAEIQFDITDSIALRRKTKISVAG